MLIHFWHSLLDMPKKDEDWHIKDIKAETIEFEEARGIIEKWSELSDIVYTHTRAKWGGHKNFKFPMSPVFYVTGVFYMIPKYSLRYLFFRHVAKKIGSKSKIREVRNPSRLEKLKHIAEKYDLDSERFIQEVKKTLKWWPLLY